MATHAKPKRLTPNDAVHPLLQQIFAEQERLNMSHAQLEQLSGVNRNRIAKLRHPSQAGGKAILLLEVQFLAEALDFEFPKYLRKNGD